MADEQDLQIVVASDQLPLVDREIGRLLSGERRENSRLGLSLVTFTDTGALNEAANGLVAWHEADLRSVELPEYRSDLDAVLGELRLFFEVRYAGWKPTMGKNRTLNGVQFKPYTHSYDEPTVTPPVAGFAEAGPVAPGTARVPVGLFDTRLDPKRELAGAFVADDDALLLPVPDGYSREWWEGHATFIAGIIHNNAPTAVLDVRTALKRPVDGQRPDNQWTVSLWDFAERLAEFHDAGIAVLNLSVGVSTADGRPPLVLERAIAHLTSDMVVVAAAGNHGSDEVTDEERAEIGMPLLHNAPLYPAALDNVLAVGALDPDGRPAAFNPRGDSDDTTAPWIDVWARGVEVKSLYLGSAETPEDVRVEDAERKVKYVSFEGWADWSGTSFAAAEITAAVARRLAGGMSQAEATEEVRANYQGPRESGSDA